MNNPPVMKGACHCSSVQFSVVLSDGLNNPRRCNCSYCRMRGSVVVTAAVTDIDYFAGAQLLTLYQFNTHTAEHYFCSRCGISTHHRRRSDPSQISVNTACLEGVSPFDFSTVPVYEGTIHPGTNTSEADSQMAGTLRFINTNQTK